MRHKYELAVQIGDDWEEVIALKAAVFMGMVAKEQIVIRSDAAEEGHSLYSLVIRTDDIARVVMQLAELRVVY